MILAEGEKKADVLLIHPQTTAWTLFDNAENKGLQELNDNFLKAIKDLEEKEVMSIRLLLLEIRWATHLRILQDLQ